jgi:arylsulfatase A-like enzyme
MAAAAAAAVASLVLGCSVGPEGRAEPSPPVEIRFPVSGTHWRHPLSGFDRAWGHPPNLHLDVFRFAGSLTSEPVELEEGGRLEFVPIVFGRRREPCHFELEVVEAGRTERVWSGEPLFASSQRGSDPFGRVASPTEVVLAPREGAFQLRWVGHGACEAAPSALARAVIRLEHEPRPPLLLVCSDTHRYDHALGDSAALMPRLQEMAKHAVVYDRAYSNASWTLPSIATTLTGLHPRYHRTGQRIDSGALRDWDRERRLPPGQFQLAWGDEYRVFTAHPRALANIGARLRQYGYETAAIVANTLYVGSGLLSEGFDLVVDANGRPGDDVNLLAQRLIQRGSRDRPLFLLVHYMDVHEYALWGRRPGEPEVARVSLRTEDLRRRYERQVRAADEYIGRLVAAWNSGIDLKHSFVAVYSDHGEHLREPHRPTETHGDSMDEALLHVPLVVRYPSALGVSPGREERIVSLVDLVPTVLDVVGAGADRGELHGRSLLRPPEGAARPVFADYQLAGDELASVRAGPFKLILNLTRGGRALIDVEQSDGRREHGIQDERREGGLEAEFEAYRERADAWAADLVSDRLVDEEFEERLRAIGYTE